MECLDTITLSMYLDEALGPGESRKVAAHLGTCPHCADRLGAFRKHEALLPSLCSGSSAMVAQCPDYYSTEKLSGYASDLLTPQDAMDVEQHMRQCRACRNEVLVMRRTLSLLEHEPLLTPPLWVRPKPVPSSLSPWKQLGVLIVQMLHDKLQFIGTMLCPEDVQVCESAPFVPAGVFRSVRRQPSAPASVHLRQTAGDLVLSYDLLYDEPATVSCTIRLDKKGAPLAKQPVELAQADRRLYAGVTSTSGESKPFHLEPGTYILRLPQEHVETHFILRAMDQPS